MYVLQKEPRWTWPVVVRAPGEGGGVTEHRFSATWRLLPAEERQRLGETDAGTDELLARSLVGVKGVQDEAGADIAALEGWRGLLIGIPWVRAALLAAYVEALSGVPSRAAAGN